MSRNKLVTGTLAGVIASWSWMGAIAQELSLPLQDVRKMSIEKPIKRIVSSSSNSVLEAPVQVFANPKVKPGLVRWHRDFATACSAARVSGKPVMLFQMMGRLDDEFC
jgi:hypothetical protein